MKFTAILFSSLLLGLMLGSCHSGQKVPEGEFLIEGFVKNLPDSSIVSLFQFENRQYAAAMISDTVTGGRFVLRDTITSKESRQLLLLVIYKKTFSVWPLSLWVVSGAKIRELIISFIIFAAAVGAAAAWRWELICRRIDALGSGDLFGNGWHVKLFQLAISRGGWTGAKQGNSIWTENYLPLAHNDSIFAAMAEILGLLGTLPLLIMMGALIYLMLKLAWKCNDSCRKMFIAATAFMIGVQALLHISVNVTLLPPSGLTLPFISYGGSSLISTMIMIGIALSAANVRDDEQLG